MQFIIFLYMIQRANKVFVQNRLRVIELQAVAHGMEFEHG